MKLKELTFEQAKGEGQSKCMICGVISWDCMMYKIAEYNDKRVCRDCKRAYEVYSFLRKETCK